MATKSVYRLPHSNRDDAAQREAVTRAQHLFAELMYFPAVDADEAAPVPVPTWPAEGWLNPTAAAHSGDSLGTHRMVHDYVPDGGATLAKQGAAIGTGFRAALIQAGLPVPGSVERVVSDRLLVGDMPIQIVNIVHTSYCTLAPPASGTDDDGGDAEEMTEEAPLEEPAPPYHHHHHHHQGDRGKSAGPPAQAIVSLRFLWRRLLHMGPQRNHVHTSLKLCFIPPYNASYILFQTGRILETGANNINMARVMFRAVALPHLRAAGLTSLRVQRRRKQNIVRATAVPPSVCFLFDWPNVQVATCVLPHQQQLSLPLLKAYNQDIVKYEPDNFAGAVIQFKKLPDKTLGMNKVAMLAFNGGAMVCVGCCSYPQLGRAFVIIMPTLEANLAMQILMPHQQALGATAGKKKRASRKRPRELVPSNANEPAAKRPRV